MTIFTRDKIILAADKSAYIEYDRGTKDVTLVQNGVRTFLAGATPTVDADVAALSVTASAHAGRLIQMLHTAAESVYTLPAALGTGMKYRFMVGAVNTNDHKIQVASASDIIQGNILIGTDAGAASIFAAAADSDTITLNGTTTGGATIGDILELEDYANGKFRVSGQMIGSGTLATPFSAAVS